MYYIQHLRDHWVERGEYVPDSEYPRLGKDRYDSYDEEEEAGVSILWTPIARWMVCLDGNGNTVFVEAENPKSKTGVVYREHNGTIVVIVEAPTPQEAEAKATDIWWRN